jgi:glycosyltransferase involved in cell wall biosynthesis
VLPTTKTFNEGLNKAAIEGLLCEVPIVASNVCGLHATVSQGIGYLVEPGDVSAFADHIYRIYQSAENSIPLKSRARILKPFYLSPPATFGSQLANYLKKNCTTKDR